MSFFAVKQYKELDLIVALSTCGCITVCFHDILICTEGECDRIDLFVHFKSNGVCTSEETAISLCNFLVSSLLFYIAVEHVTILNSSQI